MADFEPPLPTQLLCTCLCTPYLSLQFWCKRYQHHGEHNGKGCRPCIVQTLVTNWGQSLQIQSMQGRNKMNHIIDFKQCNLQIYAVDCSKKVFDKLNSYRNIF